MFAAQRLQFVHPYTQQAINITAPMPPRMQHLIDTFVGHLFRFWLSAFGCWILADGF